MSHPPELKMSHPRVEKMRDNEPDDDRLLEELAGASVTAEQYIINIL
jgi:hypothetical protein